MYEAQLPAVSNRADWIESIELINDDTNEVITDLTGVTVVVAIRSRDPFYVYMSGTSDDGHVTFLLGGVIQWRFTADEMRTLAPLTYDIGITVAKNGITEQELIGSLPVLDGVVRR